MASRSYEDFEDTSEDLTRSLLGDAIEQLELADACIPFLKLPPDEINEEQQKYVDSLVEGLVDKYWSVLQRMGCAEKNKKTEKNGVPKWSKTDVNIGALLIYPGTDILSTSNVIRFNVQNN